MDWAMMARAEFPSDFNVQSALKDAELEVIRDTNWLAQGYLLSGQAQDLNEIKIFACLTIFENDLINPY